jgi:hypothetical protein
MSDVGYCRHYSNIDVDAHLCIIVRSGLHNIGQEDAKIFNCRKTEYSTRGQQIIGQKAIRMLTGGQKDIEQERGRILDRRQGEFLIG